MLLQPLNLSIVLSQQLFRKILWNEEAESMHTPNTPYWSDWGQNVKGELTAKVRRKSLSLFCAEEALLPKHGDLRADGISDVVDVEKFELF